jgi:uncharacterized coiled-coil DUF342 family protein
MANVCNKITNDHKNSSFKKEIMNEFTSVHNEVTSIHNEITNFHNEVDNKFTSIQNEFTTVCTVYNDITSITRIHSYIINEIGTTRNESC